LFAALTGLCALYELAGLLAAASRRYRWVPRVADVGLIIFALFLSSLAGRNNFAGMGVARLAYDPPDYLALCDYARDYTPVDAIFLVPPNEEEFRLVARRAKANVDGSEVSAAVGLGPIEGGRYGIQVALKISLPGVEAQQAKELVDAAHQVCPYSNATRGNIEVDLQIV